MYTAPKLYTPPKCIPPRPSECFAKICTSRQPCASRQNRLKTHSLNTIVKVIYLKNESTVVCFFTLPTLAEAWATAAEDSAPAPSAPVTPQNVYPPGPVEHPVKICTPGYTLGGGGLRTALCVSRGGGSWCGNQSRPQKDCQRRFWLQPGAIGSPTPAMAANGQPPTPKALARATARRNIRACMATALGGVLATDGRMPRAPFEMVIPVLICVVDPRHPKACIRREGGGGGGRTQYMT